MLRLRAIKATFETCSCGKCGWVVKENGERSIDLRSQNVAVVFLYHAIRHFELDPENDMEIVNGIKKSNLPFEDILHDADTRKATFANQRNGRVKLFRKTKAALICSACAKINAQAALN